MTHEIDLVGARESDIPFVVDLLKQNGLPFADIPEKREALFLARSGGSVVGIGGVEILGRSGLLRSLAVKQDERNKGYGRAITVQLMDHAGRAGVKELYLLTNTATAFFERLGFTRIGRDSAPRAITQTSEFSSL
jgi:amino-acid N-acetyltransferase